MMWFRDHMTVMLIPATVDLIETTSGAIVLWNLHGVVYPR